MLEAPFSRYATMVQAMGAVTGCQWAPQAPTDKAWQNKQSRLLIWDSVGEGPPECGTAEALPHGRGGRSLIPGSPVQPASPSLPPSSTSSPHFLSPLVCLPLNSNGAGTFSDQQCASFPDSCPILNLIDHPLEPQVRLLATGTVGIVGPTIPTMRSPFLSMGTVGSGTIKFHGRMQDLC